MRQFILICLMAAANLLAAQNPNPLNLRAPKITSRAVAAPPATGSSVEIEAVGDSLGLFFIKTTTVEPSGASTVVYSKPMDSTAIKGMLMAEYRAVTGEIAVYETALVTARKRATTLKTLYSSFAKNTVEKEFKEILKQYAGDYLLTVDGEKGDKITLKKSGEIQAQGDKTGGTVEFLSPKSFTVTVTDTKLKLYKSLQKNATTTFFQDGEGVWRAKSETFEIILLKL